MQTIKTALVVVFLLAVLYGVYTALNRPTFDEPPLEALGFDQLATPEISLPGMPSPEATTGPWRPPAAAPTEPPPWLPTAPPESPEANDAWSASPEDSSPGPRLASPTTPVAPPMFGPVASAANDTGRTSAAAYDHHEEPERTGDDRWSPTQPAGDASSDSPLGDGLQGNPYASPYVAPTANVAPLPSAPPAEAYDAPDARSAEARGDYKFRQAWAQADRELEEGKFARALATLTPLHRDADLSSERRQQLLDRLDQLAGTVIYSTEHRLEPPYQVRRGETLVEIAQQHRVPWQLLYNVNRASINDPEALLPGTVLKVLRGPFRAEVARGADGRLGEVTLFLGQLYAGRFPAAFGDDAPPPGKYEVVEREPGRSYYDPSGRAVAPRDPNNPYGQWWLGLGGAASLHGSSRHADPHDSRGSIRLSTRDAADVFGILSLGSQVEVLR